MERQGYKKERQENSKEKVNEMVGEWKQKGGKLRWKGRERKGYKWKGREREGRKWKWKDRERERGKELLAINEKAWKV